MTILFRPLGAFGWFSYTTSRDTIDKPAQQVLAQVRTQAGAELDA
ncbi:hypothetical protein ACU5P0_17465 [Pseudomonas plecoglossicida]